MICPSCFFLQKTLNVGLNTLDISSSAILCIMCANLNWTNFKLPDKLIKFSLLAAVYTIQNLFEIDKVW